METFMVIAWAIYVAVGRGWDAAGIACVSPGLGMSMGAMFEEIGAAGDAQLETISAQRSGTR
jgi:hypothetical protein